MTTLVKFKIGDIQPNPFRNMSRYPIRRDKVDALRESMRSTSFWDNIVARLRDDGKPEISYGHHRLQALAEEYGTDREVALIIRDLDDDQMLKMMARENMSEWGTSATVEQETVRAVVEAYGAGKVTLPKPDAKARYERYAPSFSLSVTRVTDKPYTTRTIAEYLGWLEPSGQPQMKVDYSLGALELIEEGILTETDFTDLTTTQARGVVEQARRVKREREAAAKLADQEAEKARAAAEEAAEKRQQAEFQRAQAEAQAARAQEESNRRRAEEEAARQQIIAQQQREEQERAHRRERAAFEQASQQRETGRQEAAAVAHRIGDGMRAGEIGHKQARQEADKVAPPREQPPRNLDDFARKLAARLNAILSSDTERNRHSADLELFIKYQDYAENGSREELANVLRQVAERALSYSDRLASANSDDITSPFTVEVIGEIEKGGLWQRGT